MPRQAPVDQQFQRQLNLFLGPKVMHPIHESVSWLL